MVGLKIRNARRSLLPITKASDRSQPSEFRQTTSDHLEPVELPVMNQTFVLLSVDLLH